MHGFQNVVANNSLEGRQPDRNGTTGSGSNGGDLQNNRPLSPGTLALMCDEKNMIMEPNLRTGAMIYSEDRTPKSFDGHDCAELYAIQQNLIMRRFSDFLCRIITRGSIKGKFLHLTLYDTACLFKIQFRGLDLLFEVCFKMVHLHHDNPCI